MNFHYSPTRPIALALLLGFTGAGNAFAAASYDTSVNVNFTVALTGGTAGQTLESVGIGVLSGFEQALDDNSYFANTSGDGRFQVIPASGSFTVGGLAGNGGVDTLHTGLFGLMVTNNGTSSYDLSVTLDYALLAAAAGEYATTSILFDYWDEAGLLTDSAYLNATSNAYQPTDNQSSSNSAVWHLTLAAGASTQLYAQAGIESHLASADVTTVPVPAAAWLFGSALAGLGLVRRKHAI